MPKFITKYGLAVKYWLQGDSWEDATILAHKLAYGFKQSQE